MPSFKIKENSLIARIAAWKMGTENIAIVIGKTIHLFNTTKENFLNDKRWLKHELAHIAQFQRYGFMRFIFLYIIESIRYGYYHNKYEAQARKAEGD